MVFIGPVDFGGGAWRSVSFMYHGGTGCSYMMRFDLCCGLMVSLLRCGGGMCGMKSLCTGFGLMVAGFGGFKRVVC